LDDQSLDLHNSFDILWVEKDQTYARNNTNTILDEDEGALLVTPINLEMFACEEDRPSEIVGSTTNQQLKLNDELWIKYHCRMTMMGNFHSPISCMLPQLELWIQTLLKAWADTHVLTLMPQPITTNCVSLTTDKLPSSQTLVSASKSSIHSAATLKSVQILSKFWGG